MLIASFCSHDSRISGMSVPVVETGEWEAYWIIVMPKAEMSLADLLSEAGGPVPAVQADIDPSRRCRGNWHP